jgi:serine protease Do
MTKRSIAKEKKMRRLFLLILVGWQILQGTGWLGITIQDLSPQMAMRLGIPSEEGVLVSGVQFGSPAEKGGLKQGDVIVSLNAKKIPNSEALRKEITKTAPGTSIELSIIRNRAPKRIEIAVGTPPREAA